MGRAPFPERGPFVRVQPMSAPSSDLQGVILAAGKGTRIQPFSDHYPKPLLPVYDRPLLLWQVEAMRELGITDILIVIGHLGHRVVQALGDGSRWGVRIRYVEQEETLGIAQHALQTLWQNERHVSGTTMALTEAEYPQMVSRLHELERELVLMVEGPREEAPNRVYHLGITLVPVTDYTDSDGEPDQSM